MEGEEEKGEKIGRGWEEEGEGRRRKGRKKQCRSTGQKGIEMCSQRHLLCTVGNAAALARASLVMGIGELDIPGKGEL